MLEVTNPAPSPEKEISRLIDPDVVVAYADEIEFHRLVNRQGAYAELSRRPASIVFAPGGHCDLKKQDERSLLQKSLTNRSIWVRDPNPHAGKGAFVLAVPGVKDKGGLLFDEIYNSELQCRAQRLHEAFIALGLKRWKIVVEETSNKQLQSSKKGKGSSSVGMTIPKKKSSGASKQENDVESVQQENDETPQQETDSSSSKDIDLGSELSFEKMTFEHFVQTLRDNIDVRYGESCNADIDVVNAEAHVKRLGLDKDPVVATILAGRKRGISIESVDQELDFSFTGKIEQKFDLAFKVSAKILFVSAKMKGQYHSFKKAVQTIKNSVKIHVED